MNKYDKYINDDLMRKIYKNKLEKHNNDWNLDRTNIPIYCSDDKYKKEIDKDLLIEIKKLWKEYIAKPYKFMNN